MNYAFDGTFISSFTSPVPIAWGLAYEESTNSLWALGTYGAPDWNIVNLSKGGGLLSNTVIPGLTGNILGGEMQITGSLVPEPSTWAMAAVGLVGLGLFARRRRS